MRSIWQPRNPLRDAVRPGTVVAVRKAAEATLRRVAPIQCFFFRPKIQIQHLGPTVATVTILGMKWISVRQYLAIERAIDDARAVGMQLILKLGGDK